jgi:predicted DNA-binding transcriptional regulator AlpA
MLLYLHLIALSRSPPMADSTPSPDDLLLITEVAQITRRSVDTLRWLRHRGEGPKGHRAGRRVYYRRSDVAEWLAEQERAAIASGAA